MHRSLHAGDENAGGPVTGYECRVDAQPFEPCPINLHVGLYSMAPGSHTFEVRESTPTALTRRLRSTPGSSPNRRTRLPGGPVPRSRSARARRRRSCARLTVLHSLHARAR